MLIISTDRSLSDHDDSRERYSIRADEYSNPIVSARENHGTRDNGILARAQELSRSTLASPVSLSLCTYTPVEKYIGRRLITEIWRKRKN